MSAPVSHFAINAIDVDRARHFYGTVFGWTFQPWGPPGFFQIDTGVDEPGHLGALQPRRDLHPDHPTVGFECSIAVDDLRACLVAAGDGGAIVLMEPTTIDGVGNPGVPPGPGGQRRRGHAVRPP